MVSHLIYDETNYLLTDGETPSLGVELPLAPALGVDWPLAVLELLE